MSLIKFFYINVKKVMVHRRYSYLKAYFGIKYNILIHIHIFFQQNDNNN